MAKINWKSVAMFGNSLLKVLVPGVAEIEITALTLIKTGKTMTGPEKSAAVKELAKASLEATEFAVDKDLLNDTLVDAGVQAVIDSTVALHKIIADAKVRKSAGKLQLLPQGAPSVQS